jgi:DNA-binding response OmpR family regulator
MIPDKILITGRDSRALFTAARILEKGRYRITVASNGGSGIELLNAGSVALVLIDVTPDDPTVPSKLEAVRNASPKTMIVIQATPMDALSMKTMFNSGADDCIVKPYLPEELLFRVSKNIEAFEFKHTIKPRKRFFSNCCVCKKVRVDDYGPTRNKWREVEDFLKEEMDILLSSTYCPKCAQTAQEDLLVQFDRLKA